MGTKVTVDAIEDVANSSGLPKINENFDKLADEFDLVLYADGSVPVTGDLDMDSNRILNLPLPLTNAEPITRGQIDVVINEVIGDVQDLLDDEVAAAEAARADAVTAAATATTKAAEASADADDAEDARIAAEAAAASIEGDVAAAEASALAADASADLAVVQAGIATTKAGEASASASTASTAATTATTQAGIASLAETGAVAAAASLYVTSSAHALSTGDRTTTGISGGGSITTGLTVATGTINNLIDGATANTDADGVNFGVQNVAGLNIFEWNLPKGRYVLCDQFTIKNSGTQSYGNGVLYAKKADGTWVAVSADAANGGAATVTRTATATDKAGYNGFRLLGTSGATAAGRMLEIEFKFADGALNTLLPIQANTTPELVLQQNSATGGDYVWAKPVDYFGDAKIDAATPLAIYNFKEGFGTVAYDSSGNGNHIDFGTTHQATYGGVTGTNYVWTKRGLMLRKAMIQTPSLTNTRTVVACYIPLREDGSTVQWNVSSSTAIGSQHAHMGFGGHTQSTQTVHVGNGGEGVVPLYRDSNGNNGYSISRGGPHLEFSESSATITGSLGMGGQTLVTADTLRSTQMVCVYFAVYSGVLNDAQRLQIRNALRKALVVRGVYLDWRDCPIIYAGAFDIGQSNTGNLSISPADLSPTNVTNLSYTPHTEILVAGRRDEATPMATPSEYRVGFNSFPGFRALGMGYEAGMALAHEKANGTVRRKLAICKVGAGSSNVSDNTALSWNVTLIGPGSNLTGWALKSWRDMEQFYLERGIGVRLLVVNTQNGEQEANNTGVGLGWPSTYQANMQDIWNKLKEQLLFNGLKMQVGELFPFDTGQANYTQAGVDAVRAAQAAFVAANPTDTTLITSAAGLKQADKVHITADNSVIRGETQVYPGIIMF